MRVAQLGRRVRCRQRSHCGVHHHLNGLHRSDGHGLVGVQLQIVGRDKPPAQPPREIIQHRRNKTDIRIRRNARGLKSRVHQFVDEHLEWHAVLQTERNGQREAIHDAGKRRTFLGHLDENFARPAVRVHADSDVAFVRAHAEFVRNRSALHRHFFANGTSEQFALHRLCCRCWRGFRFLFVLRAARVERLRTLRVIPVDGH